MSKTCGRFIGVFQQCYSAQSQRQLARAYEECSPQLQQCLAQPNRSTDFIRSFSAAPSASATSNASQALSSKGPKPSGSSGRQMGPILLLPAALAAALGSWQLARRAEKQSEIDSRLAAMQTQPVELFASSETLPLYTPVTITGVLDESQCVFIGPRVRSVMGGTVPGNVVVTPFRDGELGGAALVVRGWAPADWQPPSSPSTERSRVEGVLIQSERPGSFVPSNEPDARRRSDNKSTVGAGGVGEGGVGGQWFWLDGPAIAEAVGLPRDTPMIVEVVEQQPRAAGLSTMEVLGGRTGHMGSATPTYPAPKSREDLLRFPVMPQGHLNYAVTWLAMSGCIAVAALLAMRGHKQRVPK